MIKLTAAYVEKIITEKHGWQIKTYHSPVTLIRSIFQSVCKEKQRLDYFSFFVFFFPKKKKQQTPSIYLFFAVLDLCCCLGFFSSWGEWGLSLVAVHGLLMGVASLVAEHRLQHTQASVAAVHRLRSCSSQTLECRHSSCGI